MIITCNDDYDYYVNKFLPLAVSNAIMQNAVVQGTAPLFSDPEFGTQPSNGTSVNLNAVYQAFIMVRGCGASLSMKIGSCSLVHNDTICSSNCSNITCHTQVECFHNLVKMISFNIPFNWINLIGLKLIDPDNSSSSTVKTTVSFCLKQGRNTCCGRTTQLFISGLPLTPTEGQVTSISVPQSSTTTEPAKGVTRFSFQGITNSYKSFRTYPMGMYVSFSMLVFSVSIAIM